MGGVSSDKRQIIFHICLWKWDHVRSETKLWSGQKRMMQGWLDGDLMVGLRIGFL